MLKQIISGYVTMFLAAVRFIILLAVCVGTGFLVVFPLWKLASTKPALYSLICLSLLGLLVAGLAFGRIRKALRLDSGHFFLSAARKLTLLAGIIGSIVLVLQYQRALAALTLLLTVALYGFLAFGLTANSRRRQS